MFYGSEICCFKKKRIDIFKKVRYYIYYELCTVLKFWKEDCVTNGRARIKEVNSCFDKAK